GRPAGDPAGRRRGADRQGARCARSRGGNDAGDEGRPMEPRLHRCAGSALQQLTPMLPEPSMRPAVLVTRATFPDIADRLREHFDVSDNPADTVWSPA